MATEQAHPNHYSNVNRDSSSVYTEGRKAKENGYSSSVNPYTYGSEFHRMWMLGWTDKESETTNK